MNKVKLIIPSEKYLQSYFLACKEYKAGIANPYIAHDPDKYHEWKQSIFIDYENQRNGRGLSPGHVPSTTFWLVNEDEYIGTGNIRHSLTDALARFGGHIGYVIKNSKQNLGYGTELLRMLLCETNALGINPVLMTCDKANIASIRVMEKNDAVLADIIENIIDGKPRLTCRYWVNTHNKSGV